MSNILKELENILKARYGKDVRQSIHDAIKKVDEVADTAQNSATKSAASALASETSAKASMESALVSEAKAKQYMETAFAGTPEGYAELVKQVGLLDIQTTTDRTLPNSKAGGYRLEYMKGNTEQKKLSGKNLLSPSLLVHNKILNWGTSAPQDEAKSVYSELMSIGAFTKLYSNYYFHIFFFNKDKKYLGHDADINLTSIGAKYLNVTLPTNSNAVYYIVEFRSRENGDLDMTTADIVLCGDNTDVTYEPYLGGVELIQGAYSSADGTYIASYNTSVCNKTRIPCKQGDIIGIKTESAYAHSVLLYNDNGYVSYLSNSTSMESSFTVPEGVTYFNVNVINSGSGASAITPTTVGAVSLTVNGKPIYVHAGTYTGGMTSPSPYYPQVIENTFDVVEMVQGGYSSSNGTWSANGGYVCSKNPIPCKSGDVVKATVDGTTDGVMLTYYNENGFSSYGWIEGVKDEYLFTIPSGVTKFNLNVRNVSGITPDTVGKITLTINGKYVGCVKGHGKNFWKYGDVSGTTAVANLVNIPSGIYTLSALVTSSDTDNATCRIIWLYSDGTSGYAYMPRGTTRTNVKVNFEKEVTRIDIYASQNTNTSSNDTFTFADIQLEQSEVMTDYEPYQETLAYFLMNEPLRLGDKLFRDSDGLVKVERNRHVIDLGTLTWNCRTNNRIESTALTEYLAKQVSNSSVHDLFCTSYLADSYNNIASGVNDKRIAIFSDGAYIEVSDSAYTEGATFKNDMSGVLLEYTLAEPTIEVLDTESQIALNALKTFDTVTCIEVDSRVPASGIKGEFGTSQVGAYTLKCMNDNDTDKVERAEMKAQIETLTSALLVLTSESEGE